jgi:hypothetical protein
MALLWMAGVEGAAVSVSSGGGGGSLSLRPKHPPEREELAPGSDDGVLEVDFSSPDFDRGRAVRWLETAVRFSPATVELDGRPAVGGFEDSLAEVPMARPLRGRLSLSWTGDAPQLWLLRHGVVATRATVPSFPAFAAALEMADEARPEATPAELRGAVNRHLMHVIDAAVRLMISVGRRLPELSALARRRVACLLMRAAIKGLRRDEILELPLVPFRAPGDDGARLASLREVSEIAGRQMGVVVGLPAEKARSRTTTPGVPAIVVSDEERGLLTDLLDLRIEHPPHRGRGGAIRMVATSIRRAVSWLVERVRGGFRGVEVPSDELLEAERSLLDELNRNTDETVDVRLSAGDGAPRRRGRRLLLPRNNPLVAGAVRLVESDDGWVYPAAAALLGEHIRPTDELRSSWRRRILG